MALSDVVQSMTSPWTSSASLPERGRHLGEASLYIPPFGDAVMDKTKIGSGQRPRFRTPAGERR
ncbi:hypothetical protein E4U13_000568, partial [Claviceps humidiphila]